MEMLCVVRKQPRSEIALSGILLHELGINKDRYKSLADEMDSTFAELAGY